MKKSLNQFAIAVWIVAALYAVLELAQVLMYYRQLSGTTETPLVIASSVIRGMAGVFAETALLVGIGAMIELLDQIRCDARDRK